MSVVYLDRDAFIAKYADNDPDKMEDVRAQLQRHQEKYTPDGWVMLERAELTSAPGAGRLTVVTFGPRCTWKTIPEGIVSPTGSLVDMSVVVAVCLVESKVASVA